MGMGCGVLGIHLRRMAGCSTRTCLVTWEWGQRVTGGLLHSWEWTWETEYGGEEGNEALKLVYLLPTGQLSSLEAWLAGSQGMPSEVGGWMSGEESWRRISSGSARDGSREEVRQQQVVCFRTESEAGCLGIEDRRESEDLQLAKLLPCQKWPEGFPRSACWNLGARIMGLRGRKSGRGRSVWFPGDGGREAGADGTAGSLLQAGARDLEERRKRWRQNHNLC